MSKYSFCKAIHWCRKVQFNTNLRQNIWNQLHKWKQSMEMLNYVLLWSKILKQMFQNFLSIFIPRQKNVNVTFWLWFRLKLIKCQNSQRNKKRPCTSLISYHRAVVRQRTKDVHRRCSQGDGGSGAGGRTGHAENRVHRSPEICEEIGWTSKILGKRRESKWWSD